MTLDMLQESISNEFGVLVYFTTPTCNVCHALKPKISKEFSINFPKIKQVFINSTEIPEIPAHFQVFSVPTILVFLAGKEFIREGRNVSISSLIQNTQRPYKILLS